MRLTGSFESRIEYLEHVEEWEDDQGWCALYRIHFTIYTPRQVFLRQLTVYENVLAFLIGCEFLPENATHFNEEKVRRIPCRLHLLRGRIMKCLPPDL